MEKNKGFYQVNMGIHINVLYNRFAWRANHLEEMIDWIRLQVEIPVYLSIFYFLPLSKAMLFRKENVDFFK